LTPRVQVDGGWPILKWSCGVNGSYNIARREVRATSPRPRLSADNDRTQQPGLRSIGAIPSTTPGLLPDLIESIKWGFDVIHAKA
jgi:hypothetical protein